MKRISFLVLIACVLQGLAACGQHKYNPEAIKLNDSAVNLIMARPDAPEGTANLEKVNIPAKGPETDQGKRPGDVIAPKINYNSKYEKAVDLLNKATKIDSNYFIAYLNKFGDQCYLRRYPDALVTGKEMIRLTPNDPTTKYLVARVFYETGDTTRARAYYQDYLNYCDEKLDTMSFKNRHYKDMQLQKGLVLILLDQQQKGREIFKTLYEKETDDSMKDMYLLYMRAIKTDIVEGKELSMTIGNKSTSIHL